MQFSTILFGDTDESFVRNRYARRRPRAGPCRHRPGPAAERQAYDQGTENDDGAHGEEQPRDVLRSRRARQERLRRGPTFLRRAGDARPRAGFVRACSERRLPEIGGRQNQSLVIPAAAGKRPPVPPPPPPPGGKPPGGLALRAPPEHNSGREARPG